MVKNHEFIAVYRLILNDMGVPGIQEIIVILFILAMLLVPAVIVVIVLVVCLKRKPQPPPSIPKQPDEDSRGSGSES